MNSMLRYLDSSQKVDPGMKSSTTYLIIALFSSLLLIRCAEPKENPIPTPPEVIAIDSTAIKERIQREQDSTFTAFFLQQYIEELSASGSGMIRGEVLFSDVMLPELYNSHAFQLLWNDSTHRQNALDALSQADQDGLSPEDYHLPTILELISQKSEEYETIVGIDVLITDGIILYGTHLLNGKTDPKTHEPNLKYERRILSDEVLAGMRGNLIAGNVQEIIEELRPPSSYYKAMMAGLNFYEALEDSGGWRVTSIRERKLEPGTSYPDIPAIRSRMLVENDLLSTPVDSTFEPELYDPVLQRAVERFQVRHGLNPDGIIGRGTVAAMNISVQEKVNLLKANMERARWIHHDLDSNYVLVNIAGFDLRLVQGDSLCWSSKVMVGKVATSTPVFQDVMEYIEVNPEWTVPFSISNNEILPKLRSDPSYLNRNNMQLLTMSGNVVDHSLLDFNDYSDKMPYIVRQGPGNSNSLGRVKFLFPNQHRVYLHDTPSKHLFAREKRAFSHGCIRVQSPFDLAERILSTQGIERAYLDSIYHTGVKYRMTLDHPLPVVITYSTAFADADLVYFYEDVYKRDRLLLKSLDL